MAYVGLLHDGLGVLSGRTQFVQYNGYDSSPSYIKCGVPQGSILGPLLFCPLLYLNRDKNGKHLI